jgi:serine/threonine protein kinase
MSRESEATAQLAPCPFCTKHHEEDYLRCPSTDMMLPLEGRRLDGKFRFLSALGSGGMASVYLAVNERVDREVAIKFLRPEVGRDTEAVARFRSEAKAAGRIGNVHICEILDLGESPIGPYIVMERLRGIDLAALIRRQTRLAPGYAVRVVRHALEGLAAAHDAGIVHRDLKPGNVFLHRTDAGATVVKLMDFGVSKFLDGSGEAETASGILLGTPEYMAPEQLEGAHKIGPAADIWAMGAILYRAITGQQVFSGPNLAAVLRSMAIDDVKPLSQVVEGVPPELEAVIHRCLDRDPAKRYPSANALSEALAPFETLEVEVIPIAAPATTVEPISELEPVPELQDRPSESHTQHLEAASVVEAKVQVVERKRRRVWLAGGLLLVAAASLAGALVYEYGADPTAIVEGVRGRIAAYTTVESDEVTEGTELPSETTAIAAATETGAVETGETGASPVPGETETGGGTEETGGETTGPIGGETDGEDNVNWPAATDRPPPSGTVRGGNYITPSSPAAATDHGSAKRECEALAAKSFAGVRGWQLANPTQLRQFIGNTGVKRSRYWTSALHDGKALVFTLPQGKKESEKADRKIARPFCIVRY